MALMSFTEQEKSLLHQVARTAIEQGLYDGTQMRVNLAAYPATLQPIRATFVTLKQGTALRGCIGTLAAHRPLVADVAYHAYAAAFNDPRFAPLRAAEWASVSLHIAVLSEPEPLLFESEAALLAQLRPGLDGLIVRDAGRTGTFLPAVWESLPRPEDFWQQLKRKAGLPAQHGSDTLEVLRYRAESI